jgi:hypothetical protein
MKLSLNPNLSSPSKQLHCKQSYGSKSSFFLHWHITNFLMVGCSKVNDAILLHLVSCPLTMGDDQTRDFATIHKCWKPNVEIVICCNKHKTNNFLIILNSQQMFGELKFALLQKRLVIAKDLKKDRT